MQKETIKINNLEEVDKSKRLDTELNPFQQSSKSPKSTIIGILFIIAGILVILHWVYIMMYSDVIVSYIDLEMYSSMDMEITPEQIISALNTCGAIAIVLSIFPIFGGVLAFQRKMFGLIVVGGILGIIAIAPLFIFVPNIISLIGVILVAVYKKEFQ